MTDPRVERVPDTGAARIGDVFWFATATAMSAALAHVAVVEFRHRVLHYVTWSNREFSWLSPIGYLACFLIAARPVALLARVVPRYVGLCVVTVVFVSLAFLSVFLLYQ